MTGFVTRLIRRVSPVEQELLTLSENLSSPPVSSGVRVTRSLVLYVCFVDRCLSSCTFSFGHCVVCSFSIYGFWLPLWYLQTVLATGRWFSPGAQVSSTNKTDRHDITEILLKVALITKTLILTQTLGCSIKLCTFSDYRNNCSQLVTDEINTITHNVTKNDKS
jgi:hypothetical protein